MKRFWRENWLVIVVITLIVGAFLFLRTPGDELANCAPTPPITPSRSTCARPSSSCSSPYTTGLAKRHDAQVFE